MVRSLLLAGNAWGLVTDRAGAGLRPSRIELLDPARVTVQVDRNVEVIYRLDGVGDRPGRAVAPPRLPGRRPGARDCRPIRYAMQSIGLGLAAEQFGAQFFGDDATPSGLLTTDQRLTASRRRSCRTAWHIYFTSGKREAADRGAR